MQNPLRRLVERRRTRAATPREMTAAMRRAEIDPTGLPADDYLIETDAEPQGPDAVDRVVHVLQVVLIFVVAILSFAVFWLTGVVVGLI